MKYLLRVRNKVRRIFMKQLINWGMRPETSDELNYYLQKKDLKVGKKTFFFDAKSTFVDVQRPWMLEIGSYCKIARGTIILQHDYSRSVLRRYYGQILCEAGKTVIGDNVFIGMNSIILMGTHIGNNVIIGAGSVVKDNIPENVVAAGNPAKIVCTLEEYYKKRVHEQLNEAFICVKEYLKFYGKYPTVKEMGAFFHLYMKRDISELEREGLFLDWHGDEKEEILESFMNTEPLFQDYSGFLKYCDERIRNDTANSGK